MSETTAAFLGFSILAGGMVLYFLPAIVAFMRRHRQRWAILLLDLFLGWSLIGWVAALVWAATSDVERRQTGPA